MSFIDNHLVPLAGRASAIAKDDPIGTAGRVSVAALVMMVGYNAAFAQVGTHAAPWFGEAEAVPELETTERAAPKSARTLADPVVFGLQSELMDLGFYEGTIDGIAGSRTRVAIQKFQRDRNLPDSGEASVRLLTQILMSPANKPVAVPAPIQRAPAKPDSIETASVEKAAPMNPTKMVVAIQRGLRNYGRHELTVDGKMGSKTARAIADFELDFGWDITGKPTPKLVKKLEEIGLLSG